MKKIARLEMPEKQNEKKGLNPFVLLFAVLILIAVLTYILPAGQFERQIVDGREIVVQGTYHIIEPTPVSPFQLFAAIHEGLVQSADIGFYVLLIGGMISVMNASGALPALLCSTSKKLANHGFWFIAALMLLFSMGSTIMPKK